MSNSRILTGGIIALLAIAASADGDEGVRPKSDDPTKVVVMGDKQVTSGPTVQNCTIERFKLHSEVMNREIDIVVVLPPAYEADPAARFPVLIAMHGRNAPYDMWANMLPLRQALEKQPMIVATFNADPSSWYLDAPLKADSRFTTFALKEFIPFLDRTYRSRGGAADRGIAGVSMGGFGAMHFVLTDPAAFASASGASGAYEVTHAPIEGKTFGLELLLGDYEPNKAAYDRLDLAARFRTAVAAKATLPKIQITCGTEDRLLGSSQRLEKVLKELGLAPEYFESAGAHNWQYWQAISPKVIDFHWRAFQTRPADRR